MPRSRSPNRDKAKELYLADKSRSLKSIAEELGVSEGTVRGWKNKDSWDNGTEREKLGNVPNKNMERSKPEKPNKNKGNPQPKINEKDIFQNGNQAAKTHGMFSKFLPPETLEIIEAVETSNPADRIWSQLMIQYAAIIRAQQIMNVESADSHLATGDSTAFAHERYESLLKAQTRAMGEYRALEKQFMVLADETDERRLKLESLQLDVDLKREKLKEFRGEGDDGNQEAIANFLKATAPTTDDVASLFGDEDA